jgi:two-component system CheB/CheR fusion protein
MPGRHETAAPPVAADAPRHADSAPRLPLAERFKIVAIGASAGGLDACRQLIEGLDAACALAFILVQHLDPAQESFLPKLLAQGTGLKVETAIEKAAVQPGHLYVIPPGQNLSVESGLIRLSPPATRHGSRLPVDFLLESLARDVGNRAVCVILSGHGSDGTEGLKHIVKAGGLAVVQEPTEAAFDGMPLSAIATDQADAVLPVREIAAFILASDHNRQAAIPDGLDGPDGLDATPGLAQLLEILLKRTGHDFRQYKPGTLQRRIERRMTLALIPHEAVSQYLDLLISDGAEAGLLAADLLINVTSFFRDPKVFAYLAEKVLPGLIDAQPADKPLRIWVAGCSTGEETYSLAMLFHEAIASARKNIVLQIFASDLDHDAVKTARDGQYPATISEQVSADRLARFFVANDYGYRVTTNLRDSIVFTVQDLLSDPPFSRLDLISCRNLLIYLSPEAQAKSIALFHFALRDEGTLLLGSAETVGQGDGRFEVVSKANRIYRRVGRSRPGNLGFVLKSANDASHAPSSLKPSTRTSRQSSIAEQCRQAILDIYAPAVVLVNYRFESLFTVGPVERYLRIAPGHPSHDLLAMAAPTLRTKLRLALQQSVKSQQLVTIWIAQATKTAGRKAYHVDIRPLVSGGENLLLLAFIDDADTKVPPARRAKGDRSEHAELEQELELARKELQDAIRDLELSGEEQKAINEEALSVNEEYQSTNEELVTSKEELQSLNEELTALNGQLQETLERQRTTSDDLQNVLFSTDVATIFLDSDFNIRFFTPATRLLFNVIATDIGRPLDDLKSLASDSMLSADAEQVLRDPTPIEREIEAKSGLWFNRRILPYRTHQGRVEGVVITFTDITERKRVARVLSEAKRQAEIATAAKSQFLAAASHDLRQPLQTLTLVQDLLRRVVKEEAPRKLIDRLDQTLASMSGMLNTLLDINQIEAGAVHPAFIVFPINDILRPLADEFAYHATAHNLQLKVVPSRMIVYSDPRLLEQMIRNILSNAFKYTRSGKVLLGCRRREDSLSVEVWDTGVGIDEKDLHAIFEEYHQVDNPAHDRTHGLGLGLSIVKRLAQLMNHHIDVRSRPGRGSCFVVNVPLPANHLPRHLPLVASKHQKSAVHLTGTILLIEDEPDVSELIEQLLVGDGHQVACAQSGEAALEMVRKGKVVPDLILADYNLPNGMDGLRTSLKLRGLLHSHTPVIILTGDISTGTLHDVAHAACTGLHKPVKPQEMTRVIQQLLAEAKNRPATVDALPMKKLEGPIIFVVDDDAHVRESLRQLLEDDGRIVEDFATCRAFLDAYRPGREACLLIDAYLPDMDGLQLLEHLREVGHQLPSIMITGNSDVPMAVHAMKAGASNFIEKPVGRAELLEGVNLALEESRDSNKIIEWRAAAARHVASLTARQRQIMTMVLAGHPSKNIAADLKISQRTVENHRASIMKKTGAKSLPALARLALAAAWTSDAEQAVADPVPIKKPRTVFAK